MDRSDNSPLEALRGDAEHIFELVFESGTDRQVAEMLRAPLECAVLRGEYDMVQKLLGAGASMGGSVHAAVTSGREQMVDYLLMHGGSVRDTDAPEKGTPLHAAAQSGQLVIARSLLLRGAKVNAKDYNQGTPLFRAARHGHVAVVEALLAAGADDTLRLYGLTRPLETAARHGHTDVMRALIENGSDVNFYGIDGRTALQGAALSQKAEAVDVLVEAGANLEVRCVMGRTALHVAACQERGLVAVLALLRNGAEVNAASRRFLVGQTPLHMAARRAAEATVTAGDHDKVVDILLRWGADETIVDEEGTAPIDLLEANVDGPHSMQEAERARKLLVNAPADRAWRRRGFLVLCRAYPKRVQRRQESRLSDANMARKTRSRARLARAGAGASINCGSAVGNTLTVRNGDDLGSVAVRVVGLEEDDLFRTIVGYL